MMKIANQFWRAFAFSLFLFGIFWLPKDLQDYNQAAEPWARFLAMLDQNTALWIFSVSLLGWILITDVRRFLIKRRQEILSRPKPETQNDVFLKERILEFGRLYYIPAIDSLNEALRISSYVMKDSWDHPAKLFIFTAFSKDITYDPKYRRVFGGMVPLAGVQRRDLEMMMVAALNEFGIRSHKLQHLVSLLISEGKPLILHQFDQKLSEFWTSRQALIQVLKDIQFLPGLSELKSYNVQSYIDDREKWDMGIIKHSLGL